MHVVRGGRAASLQVRLDLTDVSRRKEAPYSLSFTHAYHTLVPLHFPATQHDPPILSLCTQAVCLLALLSTLQGWPSLTSGGLVNPCLASSYTTTHCILVLWCG